MHHEFIRYLDPDGRGAENTEEWISPIGQSFDDYIAEQERLDPEYKKERERKRPRRELSRMLSIRRIELDLSQQDLAERMGTTVAVISRLERGTLTFTFEPKDGTKFEYVDDFVVVP
jgi:ribosome-binding protein aMBF1 (putative translation factor)